MSTWDLPPESNPTAHGNRVPSLRITHSRIICVDAMVTMITKQAKELQTAGS